VSALKPENRPSTPRAEYSAAEADIVLIRDELAGTRRMHEQHSVYITKYKAEKGPSFKARAMGAKFYGGLGRTLSASIGLLFAKPPEQTDNWTTEIEEHWENIDGKGTHGDVFCKRHSEDAIADGLVGILIDFPTVAPDVVVHGGNEKELNLRPLWSAYTRLDILSWRTATVDNVETLTQVVLRESATEDEGRFGTKGKLLYRVCSLILAKDEPEGQPSLSAVWELLEEVVDKTNPANVKIISRGRGVFRDKAGLPFRVIPLAICYAGRTDEILTALPPLLDVAFANLEHWQVATDLRYYERLCCFPQPTVEGELAPDPVTGLTPGFQSGPGVLVRTVAGSKFLWTEVSGSSLAVLRQSLEEKKDEIAELGASFLAKKTRGVETAEAKRLDAAAEQANLQTSAQGVEDGFNLALGFHAQYLGIDKANAPTITINRDFEGIMMDATVMQAYVQLVNAGMPKMVALKALQAGGRIDDDEDLVQLELEWEVGLQAAQDQKAADLAAQNPQGPTPKSKPRPPVNVKDAQGNLKFTLDSAAA
jgi:hypothetical protein